MMGKFFFLAAIILFLAVPTQALQNGLLSPTRSASPLSSSSLFRSHETLRPLSFPQDSSKQRNTALMQQANENNESSKPSLWQRLLSKASPSNRFSSQKYPPSYNKAVSSLYSESNDKAATSSLFGNSKSQIRIRWKSFTKKLAALFVALFIHFAPEPPAAHASVSYFEAPAHSRVVPSPYQAIQEDSLPEVDEASMAQESEVYVVEAEEEEAIAATPQRRTPFFSGTDAAQIAMQRATHDTHSTTVVAKAPTSISFENKQVMAASLATAAVLGGALGIRMSAGSTGGYSAYAPTGDDEEDWPDTGVVTGVGGFSQYKPPALAEDGEDTGFGLFGGFGSGVGGFSSGAVGGFSTPVSDVDDEELEVEEPVDKILKSKKIEPAVSKSAKSDEKPSDDEEADVYHNTGFDTFSELTGYQLGYPHDDDDDDDDEEMEMEMDVTGTAPQSKADDDDVGTDPSATTNDSEDDGTNGGDAGTFSQEMDEDTSFAGTTPGIPSAVPTLAPTVADLTSTAESSASVSEEAEDEGTDFAGTFSQHKPKEDRKGNGARGLGFFGGAAGCFSRQRPSSQINDDKETSEGGTGWAGTFSQHKTEDDEYRNLGFETFSEISGYKIGYDHDDELNEEDLEEENRGFSLGGGAGTFSQRRPSSTHDSGGWFKNLDGGADTFSRTRESPSADSTDSDDKGKGSGINLNIFGKAGSFSQHQPEETTADASDASDAGVELSEDEPVETSSISIDEPEEIAQAEEPESIKLDTDVSSIDENVLDHSGDLSVLQTQKEAVDRKEKTMENIIQEAKLHEPAEADETEESILGTVVEQDAAVIPESDSSVELDAEINDSNVVEQKAAAAEHEPEVPDHIAASADSSAVSDDLDMVDTPVPEELENDEDDGIAASAFKIAPDAIMRDLEEIEKMEQERIERVAAKASLDDVVTPEEESLADKEDGGSLISTEESDESNKDKAEDPSVDDKSYEPFLNGDAMPIDEPAIILSVEEAISLAETQTLDVAIDDVVTPEEESLVDKEDGGSLIAAEESVGSIKDNADDPSVDDKSYEPFLNGDAMPIDEPATILSVEEAISLAEKQTLDAAKDYADGARSAGASLEDLTASESPQLQQLHQVEEEMRKLAQELSTGESAGDETNQNNDRLTNGPAADDESSEPILNGHAMPIDDPATVLPVTEDTISLSEKQPMNAAKDYAAQETSEDLTSPVESAQMEADMRKVVEELIKGESAGDGTTQNNERFFTNWFEELTESFSQKMTEETAISTNGDSEQPNVLFFATVKKDQEINTPPEPEDIAVFAGVVPDSAEEAPTSKFSQVLTPLPSSKIPTSHVLHTHTPGDGPPIGLATTKNGAETGVKPGIKPVRLIPINEPAVELTSGLLGAAVGFSVGGPILSLLGASAANYASRDQKRAGDMYDVTQMISESTIGSINLAGAVLNTFEVDEIVADAASKDEVKPLLSSAQGTLKCAGDVLSVAGDLNFLVLSSVLDLSEKAQLPSKASGLVREWWQSIDKENHGGIKNGEQTSYDQKQKVVENKEITFSI